MAYCKEEARYSLSAYKVHRRPVARRSPAKVAGEGLDNFTIKSCRGDSDIVACGPEYVRKKLAMQKTCFFYHSFCFKKLERKEKKTSPRIQYTNQI
ncbi:hypothetical protein CDAR_109031 [Caerostris darwini]|uniref:Uncharacterized protein n=1 Tax=Caerostris darwini TaxID=1538125 RepID=A0AAV4VFM4_9ARAC|nr:hypothetical protein CDAR_109031 [Caerostris darwini]